VKEVERRCDVGLAVLVGGCVRDAGNLYVEKGRGRGEMEESERGEVEERSSNSENSIAICRRKGPFQSSETSTSDMVRSKQEAT